MLAQNVCPGAYAAVQLEETYMITSSSDTCPTQGGLTVRVVACDDDVRCKDERALSGLQRRRGDTDALRVRTSWLLVWL